LVKGEGTIFKPTEKLSDNDREFALKAVIKDGVAAESMTVLSGGVFLVALALQLGASNLVVGLLAAIPPLGNLLQIPAIFLVEKVRNRRLIAVVTATISRTMWLGIAAIPFFVPSKLGLTVLVIVLLARSIVVPFTSVAWNSWMRDLIPPDRLGSFFARRMRLSVGTGMMLSLGAGFFIDRWKGLFPNLGLQGYSILFFLASLAGLLGVYFISGTPEPRMPEVERSKFFATLVEPFRDQNFRNLIHFSGAWSFAANLAAPFFTVYMLRRLGFGVSFVIVLTVLSQLTHIFFLRIWGIFTDRTNNKSVLAVSGGIYMLAVLGWTFTTLPEKYFFTVPLLVILHILMGMSISGVNLASGNIGFKLAPPGRATAYLATRNMINSLCSAIGPILGGFTADFFSQRQLSLAVSWSAPGREVSLNTLSLRHWDFFFVSAFIIGLYAIHRLTSIVEEGDIDEKELLLQIFSELGRDVKSLSSIGGMRYMTQFVTAPARYVELKVKEKKSSKGKNED
jgi:MFS family permease